MTPLFSKLNLKHEHEILVVDPPPGFQAELDALSGVEVRSDAAGVDRVEFALIFVRTRAAVEAAAAEVLPGVRGDGIVWFAYPKASSRRYRSEIGRDRGWEAVGRAGFEPVRQVAIDDEWSALRFRRPEFIKTMKRDPAAALTEEGRARLARRDE